jgi:hypothetical protein
MRAAMEVRGSGKGHADGADEDSAYISKRMLRVGRQMMPEIEEM